MHLPHPGDGHARSALPYGAVMATAGASHLARQVGPHRWATPLLILAVVTAIAIPLRSVRQGRAVREVLGGEWSFGDFTVPLGLAVVAVGIASEGGRLHDAAAPIVAGLSWLTSVTVLARLAATTRPRLHDVAGSWFLAPAAALGDALAVYAVAPSGRAGSIAGWAGLLAGACGIVAYLVVVALATARILRYGLRGAAKAPWWISAGCGGLAAATAGRVADAGPIRIPGDGVQAVVVGLWLLACLALIPVVVVSLGHVLRGRGGRGRPPWPPTFSTAVFALGTLEAARWADSCALERAGRVAGWTTVALWCATVVLLIRHILRRG